MDFFSIIALTTLLVIAIITDLSARTIPNWLNVLGIVIGLLVSLLGLNSGIGLAESLTGCMVGGLFFMPLYAIGKMGAGDVKLLAMVGSFLGAESVLMAGLCGLVAGGILAGIWSILCHRYSPVEAVAAGSESSIGSHLGKSSAFSERLNIRRVFQDQRYPYAPAIASGVYLGSFLQFT